MGDSHKSKSDFSNPQAKSIISLNPEAKEFIPGQQSVEATLTDRSVKRDKKVKKKKKKEFDLYQWTWDQVDLMDSYLCEDYDALFAYEYMREFMSEDDSSSDESKLRSSSDERSEDEYDYQQCSTSKDFNIELPDNNSKCQPTVKPYSFSSGSLSMEEQNHLEGVWKAVWDHPDSKIFHFPADRAQPDIDITHYLQIIHNPMDLESIRLRLKNGFYGTVKDCIEDFHTIFTNCYAYNKIKEINEEIVDKAMSLKDFFLVSLKAMSKEEKDILIEKNEKRQETDINWTIKLEDIAEDEMKLILPLLTIKDLKNLKLASKRCALLVTQWDKRMNHWNIQVIREYCPMPILDVYANLSLATQHPYFKDVSIILYMDHCYKCEYEGLSDAILRVCSDNLVILTIELERNKYHFLNDICLPKLKALHLEGFASGILNNKNIADTVPIVTVRWFDGNEDIQRPFSRLEYLECNSADEHFTKMISPHLSTLIIVDSIDIDFDNVSMLLNLKTLIVDATTLNLVNKCSDNIEDLTISCYEDYQSQRKQKLLPNDLICPRLKKLTFGQNCHPSWNFIMNQISTLEILVVPGMLNRNDSYPYDTEEFNFKMHSKINAYDLDKLRTIIRNSPNLHSLVLPSNLKKKVKDSTGRVKIYFNIQDAARALSLFNSYVFKC